MLPGGIHQYDSIFVEIDELKRQELITRRSLGKMLATVKHQGRHFLCGQMGFKGSREDVVQELIGSFVRSVFR